MTPDDIRNVLSALLLVTDEITPREIKSILRILAAHKIYVMCPECNKPISDMEEFSWDHIWPKARGGNDNISNLLPMHKHCNEDKGKRIIINYLCASHRISLYQDNTHQEFQKKAKHKSIKHVSETKFCAGKCRGKHK